MKVVRIIEKERQRTSDKTKLASASGFSWPTVNKLCEELKNGSYFLIEGLRYLLFLPFDVSLYESGKNNRKRAARSKEHEQEFNRWQEDVYPSNNLYHLSIFYFDRCFISTRTTFDL